MLRKIFKKGELKFLWPFYAEFLIARSLSFAPAFLILYFTNIGLDLSKIGFIMATTSLFSLLFEVPTGAIADIYGRKFSVLLGYFLEGLSFFLLYFFTDYYVILAISALLGIAVTLSSGAKEAWTTELIKKKNNKLLQEFFIKSYSLPSFALIISGIIGVFLVKTFGISIIFIAAAASFLISIIILLPAEEYYKRRKVKVTESFKELKKQTQESLNYSKKHEVIFYFILATGIIAFAQMFSGLISWTPFLKELNFPEYGYGYLWSAMGVLSAIAPYCSRKLKKNKEKRFIITGFILFSLTALSIIFVKSIIPAIIVLLLLIFFQDAPWPVHRMYFHKFIPNRLRATIGSVESMIIAFVGILALPLAGYLLELYGPQFVIFSAGVITIPSIILMMLIKEKSIK